MKESCWPRWGCWGTDVGTCNFKSGKSKQITVETLFGHSMIGQLRYAELNRECGGYSNRDVQAEGCKRAFAAMNKDAGQFDICNIYDTCAGDTLSLSEKQSRLSARRVSVTSQTR